jgi:hypothetical protein
LILEKNDSKSEGQSGIEKDELLKNAGLPQLRDPRFRSVLSREELSNLAQRELGVSKWKLMKLCRDEMEKVIENAFENVDTLNTIAKRSASKGR